MNLRVNLVGVISALILIATASLLGAENEPHYELEELIELGLEHSVHTKTEELRLENTRSSLITTYLDFLPSASFNVSRHYSDLDTHSAGFNVSKNLSLNEPRYFNWRRANIDWENAQLSYEEQVKQTVFDIFSRFIRVAEAQKRVEIQTSNLTIQERILEQVELLYNLEQRSLIELKQAEISLINAQIAYSDAQLQYQTARENLFLYLNIEDNGYPLADLDIPLIDEVPEYSKPVEVVKAENELQKSSISLTQSRLNFLPNLSLSYNYSHRHSTELDNDLFDFDKYSDSYTISLSASYPLFNWIEHRQHHHRNKRNLKSQELMLDNLTKNKQQTYEQLIREWEREKRLFDLAERRNELAEETLELSRNKFELGILSLLELEQAMTDHLESTIEVTNRYYQRLLKQEEIRLLLSEPILGRW